MASPSRSGFKVAGWYSELTRSQDRLVRAREVAAHGKLSGAMGTFAHLDPSVEDYVCKKLGLKAEGAATQVVPRDRHAEYVCELAVVAAGLERIATEIRHLQRTEVLEVEEPFSKDQKGSSAMPHKRNPVASENICGLARLVRSHALAALEDVALWHERDISHSSVERVILPDATILLDYMMQRLNTVLAGLQVYPANMKRNMAKTVEITASQRLLLALVDKGLGRDESYRKVQAHAMKAWQEGVSFSPGCVSSDPAFKKHLYESGPRTRIRSRVLRTSRQGRLQTRRSLIEVRMQRDPIQQFRLWFAQARKDRRMDLPEAMCLSTVNAQGRPSARMVLLKDVERQGFTFFTNIHSPKAKELIRAASTPR